MKMPSYWPNLIFAIINKVLENIDIESIRYLYSLLFAADVDIRYYFWLVLILNIRYFFSPVLVLKIRYFNLVLSNSLLVGARFLQ